MKNKLNRSKHPKKKFYTPKGELSSGMAYVVLAILIIVAGGSLMTGNIIPRSYPTRGQPVITLPIQIKPGKDNLQLYTFPGATYTPTPSPTPLPIPTHIIPPTGKVTPPPPTSTGGANNPTSVPTTPKPTVIPPGIAI